MCLHYYRIITFAAKNSLMKKYTFLFALIVFSFVANAQNADSTWIVNNYTKTEKYITMRDGIKLFTSIYIPKDNSEKHPILMTRTPYSCAPYGENNFSPFWHSYEKNILKKVI